MFYAIMKTIHQKALQLIQNHEWDSAHQLIQNYSDPISCQIHGYLHRIEGDFSNARYWYRRADLAMPDNSLEEELKFLLVRLTNISS